jgi:hypothetical protein
MPSGAEKMASNKILYVYVRRVEGWWWTTGRQAKHVVEADTVS